MRDRVPSPLTQQSRFKSHHWHLLCGALGEALLDQLEMEAPQLEAMQHWLRVCGFMRHKATNPLVGSLTSFLCLMRLLPEPTYAGSVPFKEPIWLWVPTNELPVAPFVR